MPAQLDLKAESQHCYWLAALLCPGQEVRGSVWFVFLPHLYLPVMLVWHWGWGLLQLAGLQILGQEAPQRDPPTSMSLETRPEAAFKDHLPLQWAPGKGMNPHQ